MSFSLNLASILSTGEGTHTGTQKEESKPITHTCSSYLSECLEHLRGLVLLALLGHQHHLLDHADAALVGRRRPTATQPVPWLQHQGCQDVAPFLGGCPLPAVLRAGSCSLLAFGLLGTHSAALMWTVTKPVPLSSDAEAGLINGWNALII